MLVPLSINNAEENRKIIFRVCRSLFCPVFRFFIFHRINIRCERMSEWKNCLIMISCSSHTKSETRTNTTNSGSTTSHFFLLMRMKTVAERYKYIWSDNAISWSFHSCCMWNAIQRERITAHMQVGTSHLLKCDKHREYFSLHFLHWTIWWHSRPKETDLWPLRVVLVDLASFCSIYRTLMFRHLGTHTWRFAPYLTCHSIFFFSICIQYTTNINMHLTKSDEITWLKRQPADFKLTWKFRFDDVSLLETDFFFLNWRNQLLTAKNTLEKWSLLMIRRSQANTPDDHKYFSRVCRCSKL